MLKESGEPQEINPEEEQEEPTLQELVEACSEVGIEPDEFEMFEEGEFNEALGYAYSRLLEIGEDPDIFLAEKGVFE